MALVPENSMKETVSVANMQTSRTYNINFDSNDVEGMCDGVDAVIQTVYKILNTERYKYLIYDRNYGVELKDLIGKPPLYVSAIIKGRITEALENDDRILSVDDFEISRSSEGVIVEFTVRTVFGDGNVTKSFVI